MKTSSISSLLWALLTAISPICQATTLWRGDFETNDFSQWDYQLHPQGFSITHDCVNSGHSAGLIRLTGDSEFLWKGRQDLNRSELQFKPPTGTTIEGKDTFFRFSFYLPQTLSSHAHALGYWESHGDFQQMMRFNITGTTLSFQETAATTPFWEVPTGASAEHWHQIEMHIHWSIDTAKGFVQTWVDGTDMGSNHFSTLNKPQATMFTQLGLLRAQENSIEAIIIDDAVATDNLAELQKYRALPLLKTCNP